MFFILVTATVLHLHDCEKLSDIEHILHHFFKMYVLLQGGILQDLKNNLTAQIQ